MMGPLLALPAGRPVRHARALGGECSLGYRSVLYGVNRPHLGAIVGVAAVFFRELALPYCVLGLALAVLARRRGEAADLACRADGVGRLLRPALARR